ncbi:hypothetical protein T552_02892 [Pneumocystis carinii B80]|uniref:JmjC domain-containing protein n=1 Tax=Pneumocystis carinii (strain B80) TaxID=1408658 RepID=A0A0W4ZDE6_PNEC8|nr:hypothetical protein T552_02892 [Pneumocystis carinii B80]KTW26411.1 hypothetical protein T552_02892 [Pneumocystis carinii B80]
MEARQKQYDILKQLEKRLFPDVFQSCGMAVDYLIRHSLKRLQVLQETPFTDATHMELKYILDRMNDTLRLSTEKFYSYPFSEVPFAWKRLYAYSSILKAMIQIEMHEKTAEIIKTLDMALIMTNGADIKAFLMTLLALQEPQISEDHLIQDFYVRKTENHRKIQFPIRYAECPSLEAFQRDMFNIRQPLVIKNSINHWPALAQDGWIKIKTLLDKTHQGLRIVPVEIGKSYTSEDWGQRLMPFYEFLEKYILQKKNSSNEKDKRKIGYLAQHDLFSQIPALREQIAIPDYCFVTPPPILFHQQEYIKEMPTLDEPLLNAWFGGEGTVSPLHTDPYHNILSQVVGWKYVRLYAPEEREALYPRSIEGSIDMSNTSQVDLDNPDTEKFPKFLQAKYVEGIIGPGDCLYIPVGWWHYIRSLSISFSVSFWWN